MNERGHMYYNIPEYTMTHIHACMTMARDCVNASMFYTVRDRPQMIAKGIKRPLSPSWITNTTYECKPGLTVLSIYVSTKQKLNQV